MEALQTIFQTLGQRWEALSFNQRVMAGTLLMALIFSSVFLFQQAQEDYDVLYSNLSLNDASAITAKLKEEKKPFKLADGGTTIMVPRAQKNDLILETASELNSEQTVNLSQIPPVVTGEVQAEWIKKLNTNTIISVLKNIRGIKNAQVIIAQPEKNLFIEEEEPPRASVMLMVEPGFRLRDEQIKTIKNLVSHAVPGLTMENVVIADNSGNSLEGPGSATNGGLSTADARRKAFEEETTKKVARVLGPVVGKENVVVSVSALLNFDQSQSQIHRLIPSGGSSEAPVGVAVSQQSQTEEYSGGKKPPGAGGEPGVETNAAPSYVAEDDKAKGEDSQYKFGKSTTNFEVSKEDKTVVYAQGAVERMTVAVVLNKVLTSQETQEIRDLVANASGADFARGDSVEIKGFQFTQPLENSADAMAEAAKQAQDQAFWLQLATIITVGLMVIVASFIFYSLIKQPAEGQLVEEPVADAYDYDDAPDDLIEMRPMAQIEAHLDPEMEVKREAITNAIEADPADAARLLLTYMHDM